MRSLATTVDNAAAFGALIAAEQESTGRRVDAAQQQQVLEALWRAEPGGPDAGEAASALVKLWRGELV